MTCIKISQEILGDGDEQLFLPDTFGLSPTGLPHLIQFLCKASVPHEAVMAEVL